MKKILLFNVLIFIAFAILNSQPVLKYQVHSLKAGINNPMIYCEYADPGQGGANMIWDFRQLKEKETFTGFLNNSQTTDIGVLFPESNTELIEFNSRFYFNVTSSMIEEWGYSSADGKSQIRYSSPSIKMKYPFRYGDAYSGTFSGNSLYNGITTGDISGDYSVEADAYGKIILPGNRIFDNTLRVRSEKNYESKNGTSGQQIDIVTFRWYTASYRYPLLVLTRYNVTSSNSSVTYYQAAYNNKAAIDVAPVLTEGITLYPNPTSAQLMLRLDNARTGTLYFEIYDANGNRVRTFQREAAADGTQLLDISGEITGLMPAGYILFIKNGDILSEKSFTLAAH
jgi:hypothetical protein